MFILTIISYYSEIRVNFIKGDSMIYLDNCATTKPREEVVEAVVSALKDDFANPSSLHRFGHEIEKKIDVARENLARLVNVSPSEIYFTSSGTESNNIALHGFINKNKRLGNKIITTKIEHASVLEQLRSYVDKGFEVVEIGVDENANLDLDNLYREIDDNTIVVGLFHVNNEIGTVNPIEEIVKKIKSINKNVLVHIDGVQAIGKIDVDLRKIGCDSYSMSGHKIYGPKGIGALYLKSNVKINSLVIGGGQESGLRSGTENVPGILGFGIAAKIIKENFSKEHNHAVEIKKYLINSLNTIGDIKINTPENSSPYIVSVSIKDTRAEVLLHYLEQDEIYVSTASACTSNGTHKSHVLEAMGIKREYAEGTIRICSSKDITIEDIDLFIDRLKFYVNEIRSIMKR